MQIEIKASPAQLAKLGELLSGGFIEGLFPMAERERLAHNSERKWVLEIDDNPAIYDAPIGYGEALSWSVVMEEHGYELNDAETEIV